MNVPNKFTKIIKRLFVRAITRDIAGSKLLKIRLLESEEYYRKLVDTSPDAIVIVDASRCLSFASKKAYEMFGIPANQSVVGLPIIRWVASEDKDSAEERLKESFIGELKSYGRVYSLIREDGTKFSCEITTSPLNDADGRVSGLLLVCRDVTARRQAEEALRSSEQKYRTVFESANDPIFVFDPATEIILEANSKAFESYGFSPHELIGLSLKSLSLNVEKGEMAIRRTLETGNLKDFETVHVRKDGTSANFLVNASVIEYKGTTAILSINRDITERKRSDEVLRLQSAALQTAANAIVITDHTGRIVYVNSAFSSLTGYSASEALGKNPNILRSGEQPPEFYENLWRTIKSGNIWKGEIINRRKDGSLYTEEMTIAPVLTDLLEITHFVAIKTDTTDRKILQDQLIQAQKMEAIGTLAGGIAHDFNNILGIIMGHLSVMTRVDSNAAVISTSAETIMKAVQRGSNLVHQILTFARKTEVSLQPVEINGAVVEVAKMLEGTFPKTIEITKELDENSLIVSGDHTQLIQAILNLCINSRDAMEGANGSKLGSGKLTLRTGKISGTQLRLRFSDAIYSEYVTVTVSDTGSGFDLEIKKKIFEPFFTTKGGGKGTGLGLAVVYGVVRSHHGFVDVESQVGIGTTFIIYLPALARFINPRPTSETESHPAVRGSERILLIEDEPGLREFLIDILEENGYKVLTASDGAEGIDLFLKHHNEISLVLSDLGLPKVDGEKVFEAMKLRDPDVKVILSSGYLEPQLKSDLIHSGIKGFLQKPYSYIEVLEKIREVIDADK